MNRLEELLKKAHQIASDPRAQLDAYLAQGKKVIACAPIYTPEELVHGMGMVPMGVWGADLELDHAKQFFPSFICSVMQSILEMGMRGGYEGISGIMIPSLCDSMKALGENWKYAVPTIPFTPADYPQNRKLEAGFLYTQAVYKRQIRQLEEIGGCRYSEEALRESNAIYSRHDQVMQKLSRLLADHPSITAAQRSDLFKSALFMRKEEHTELIEAFMGELCQVSERQKKLRIVTTGIQADQPGLLEIFDEGQLHIVADDVAQESRQYAVDMPELADPIAAAAKKFCDRDCCSVLYDHKKKRIAKLVETAKERRADGIVYIQTKFCDPEEFDYVPMKKACEEADIPLLMIEVDRQMTQFEQARTAISAFVEILRAGTLPSLG